jgi:Holliday junction DNA helicase RuvA
MIGQLTGILIEKIPPQLIIDCQGVGYEVNVPMGTFYTLPPLGDKLTLLTHLVVREDAQLLYGFATAAERTAFRQLIKTSGVGARMALAILSGMTVAELHAAIGNQDINRFVKVPGVGKKTAERLLLELKGKITDSSVAALLKDAADGGSGAVQMDILQALVALGYSEKDANLALRNLPAAVSNNVSEGIRHALRSLAR